MSSPSVLRGFLSTQTPDWKTSSGVAHPFVDRRVEQSAPTPVVVKSSQRAGYFPFVYFPERWKVGNATESLVRDEELKTTSASTYVPKYTYTKDEILRGAPSCERVNYAVNYLHQPAKGFPVCPPKIPCSQYQQEYTEKTVDVPKLPATKCSEGSSTYHVRRLEAAGEPRLNIAEAGNLAQLDIYAATSLLAHRPFTSYERKSILYEKPVGSFHDTYEVPKSLSDRKILPDIRIRRNPVYDEVVFQSKASARVLPRKTYAVPHRGLLTETQEQYQLP